MITKRIYFVRHGQSTQNITNIDFGAENALTENGIIQAKTLANRLKEEKFDVLISSTYLRAFQTAEIVNEELNLEILKSDLFIEKVNASSTLNIDPEERLKILHKYYSHFHTPGYKFEDAEIFEDLMIIRI